MNLIHVRILAIAVALSCAGVANASAPPNCGEPGKPPPYDHERARAALTRGEVVPLRRVLEAVERQGDILKIELTSTETGAFVYKLKMLSRDGKISKRCVDARTGVLLPACPET